MMAYWADGLPALQKYAGQLLVGRKCFHWALAFPEIIELDVNPLLANDNRVSVVDARIHLKPNAKSEESPQ